MKILARNKDSFICEIGKDEIANLVGHYYAGSSSCPKIEEGQTVKISDMFLQIEKLQRNEDEINVVRKILSDMLIKLERITPIIKFKDDKNGKN
jgi:hypothetical protein